MSDEKVAEDEVKIKEPIEAKENPTEEKTELQLLQERAEKSEKEYLYLRAEFDNFRKQSIKERSDLIKFGSEPLARDLLSVLDVFQTALASEVTAENFQSFLSGVKMTEKELGTVLNKHGIFEISCKEKPFNPEQAEALSQVPTSDLEEGHVFDVMRKGYLYHDKVLRHAQVVIATKPAENSK